MSTICGSLLRIIYDSLYWGQNISVGGKQSPALLVLDEAHIYLKNGENSISSKTIQKIAKAIRSVEIVKE